jgi:hypothetical protein
MFEWLEREISSIKTPRFHVVSGSIEPNLRHAILESSVRLPAAYKEFVLTFGNAKLYRASRDGYRLGVFSGPMEETLDDGTRAYEIGFHDGARVYVGAVSGLAEYRIVEVEAGRIERVSGGFEAWLTACCTRARNAYGAEKWTDILRGPEPFTSEEIGRVEARRAMRWRVLGIDAGGNHVFEVTNASCRTLPVLTVGVRSMDGRLNGAVRLKIRHLDPGQTMVLHADCYKDLIPPDKIEVFAIPEPQPEDRDWYGEFGG